MSPNDDIKALLTEIRDNQKVSLERQQEQLEVAQQQLERSNRQVSEALDLQKQAMARFKSLSRIVLPAIILCIVLIGYLVVRYL